MHWFFKLILAVFIAFIVWTVITIIYPKIAGQKIISDSEVSGLIFQNQLWSGEIRVTGDLITLPGVTVTLKPGTKIIVANQGDKNNFDLLPWHLKSGINVSSSYHGVATGEPFWDEGQKIQIHFSKLLAVGTKEQPIQIRSWAQPGSSYDFNVLKIGSGVLAFVRASNYRRGEIGKDVRVSDALFLQTGECAICIKHASPNILNNVFEDSLHENIWVEEANPRIEGNLFKNLSGAGIRVDIKKWGAPVILKNHFEMPQKLAVDILSGGGEDGILAYNTFSGNSEIKIPCDSKIRVNNNHILGLVRFWGGSCAGSFIFGPNFWGVDKISVVLSDKIIKSEGDFKVIIPSILK